MNLLVKHSIRIGVGAIVIVGGNRFRFEYSKVGRFSNCQSEAESFI